MPVFVVLLFMCFIGSIQGDDSPCWGINGRCQYTSEPCGRYRPGYCAGPTNRQCCVIGEDLRCWARGGTCKNNWNYCSGSYVRGLCGGGLSRQCCV
uniref:Lysozyme 1-like n=1 Tax=Crassostrea virginica TaxID=6565 RepID=A0A8B8F0Z2_CRAVI|nr:lysozyme 1-like [Crassostrea virginica]